MIIEYSLNPNCSESVYRFKKADIDNLPGGKNFIIQIMKNHLGSFHPVEGYSELRPRDDSDLCLYFYQTSCEELEQELISSGIAYKAEKPFTSSIATQKKYLYEPK